jgi:predicted O-methyltransferase YrrM
MTHRQWTAVDRYISDMFLPPDPILDWVLKTSTEAGLPDINVSPNQGKFLMILAQTMQATAILEVGTLGGYSTIWLARGLSSAGRLISLEVNPTHAEVARANIARAGLAHAVDIRQGAALDLLPQIEKKLVQPFDLIFIDADKPNIPAYFSWALRLARQGSLIIIDNVIRDGAVVNSKSSDPSVLGVRRLSELIAHEPRVSATAIQTVGSKGYDGFAIIRVVTV